MRKLSSTFVPPFGGDRSFIRCVTVDFGPSELLGPFFIEADAAARRAGVFLTIGDFSELVAVNRANRSNFPPLIPLFDPCNGGLRSFGDRSWTREGTERPLPDRGSRQWSRHSAGPA